MHFLVVLPLLVATVLAAPAIPATPCLTHPAPVAYGVAPVPYVAPAPIQVEVQPQIQYDFSAPVAFAAPAPVAYVAAPAPVEIIKKTIEHDFPAPISAPAPAPVVYAIPAPVQVAAPAPVHVFPHAFETRVHYAETPVVVGQTARIMKPNLGAEAHITNFDFMGLAQTKGASQESYVQKSKVLAPSRSVSEITPQVTVQHPTNVQKVAAEVLVAAPYAQPYPVPVAPQYEIH
ncbi:Uncharacterized protein APZ42_032929 [Daphnia magna]|uniref:Uncharacterized protein n=1 Tax=Daphnia magna TaxID=35525 RepID=A0A0P5ZEH5_9CRUS|nr:Uncharacterized protein APZ42_032929 [Daphnia magna]